MLALVAACVIVVMVLLGMPRREFSGVAGTGLDTGRTADVDEMINKAFRKFDWYWNKPADAYNWSETMRRGLTAMDRYGGWV